MPRTALQRARPAAHPAAAAEAGQAVETCSPPRRRPPMASKEPMPRAEQPRARQPRPKMQAAFPL
eukprot:11146451-Alexandrium_andersonii.AAC.1